MSAISWFEIPATDIERARRFYEAILGIAMRPLDLGDLQMALFPAGGGAICQHKTFYKPAGDAGALVYLDAGADLAVVLARVEKAGGKVTVPKRQISPEYGYMGVFVDTEGNRVALHSMG